MSPDEVSCALNPWLCPRAHLIWPSGPQVLLFKQYDTRPGVATGTFHNSFPDPFHLQDQNCPERKSVELRILLTFPKSGMSPASSKL